MTYEESMEHVMNKVTHNIQPSTAKRHARILCYVTQNEWCDRLSVHFIFEDDYTPNQINDSLLWLRKVRLIRYYNDWAYGCYRFKAIDQKQEEKWNQQQAEFEKQIKEVEKAQEELHRLAEIGRAVEFFADKTDEHGESYHVPYIEDGNTYVTAVCHSEIQGIVKAYRESHACMDCETADGCDECRG